MRQWRLAHLVILCGPVDGRGAKMPVSLSSIQCFGAFSRFMCFFGPRAMAARSFVYGTNYQEGRRMRATKKASDRSAAAIARSRERID